MFGRLSSSGTLLGLICLLCWACVLPAPPLLQGVSCTADEDCLYGMKCCASVDTQGVKICQAKCLACKLGQKRPCFDDAQAAYRGKGTCKDGFQLCGANGTWEKDCQGAVYPAKEVCDGLDNNCDGRTDEGLTGCECGPVGTKRACFTGDRQLAGVGACQKGEQTCQQDNSWGSCQGEVAPSPETCDGVDNDCDGQTDEELSKPCKDKCGDGTIDCKEGKWTTCSAIPSKEDCNGKDDDCDGKTDNLPGEDKPLSASCYSGTQGTQGTGPCKAGTRTCNAGSWSTCVGEVVPQPKDCTNGKDNDCDGKADTDCACPGTCSKDLDCQVAACGSKTSCNSGACAEACPSKCVLDSDCDLSGCGARNRCVNGVCDAAACPSTCKADADCQITPCANKRQCVNNTCQAGSACPSTCQKDIDCQSCTGTTACLSGKCVPPCRKDSRWNQSCTAGQGVCANTGTWKCLTDGKQLACSAKEDLSKKQAKETCGNNLDDDCNGFSDDGCGTASGAWALTSTGAADENGVSVATDKLGNIYLAGDFDGTMTIGTTQLISQGSEDLFVAKFDKTGKPLWAISAGSSLPDTADGIGVDALGNVYIGGSFDDDINFRGTTLPNEGIYVAKLDTNGKFLWVRQIQPGSATFYTVQHVSVDANGNVYITGDYDDTLRFGNISISTQSFNAGFAAKFDNTGKAIWAVSLDSDDTTGYGITGDLKGNAYVTGRFEGTIQFGSLNNKTALGKWDIFVAKLDPSGKFLWSNAAGGQQDNAGTSITVDPNENVYVSGTFQQTTYFGTTSLTSVGSDDVFVTKLDKGGNFLWATKGGGSAKDTNTGITLDSKGNVYITGAFQNTASFGSNQLTSKGKDDLYIARLDNAGSFTWSTATGGTLEVLSQGICITPTDSLLLTGSFKGTALFAPKIASAQSFDFFLWHIPKP